MDHRGVVAVAVAFEGGHQGGFVADLLPVPRTESDDLVTLGEQQSEMRSRSTGSAVYSESRYDVAGGRALAIAF